MPPPPIVGATFEHVAGPTKPIEGVVRLKATGHLSRGSMSRAGSRRPGPRPRP